MMYNNYMLDTYFLQTLYPMFDNSPYTVVSCISENDIEYKDNHAYSLVCSNIYTIIKTCTIAKNNSHATFCSVMETINDDILTYSFIKDIEKFVQSMLCYYILNTSEKYVDSITEAQDKVLSEIPQSKEEKDLGSRNEVEKEADSLEVSSWDEYYYNIAKAVAANSKCFSRKIGAVLVSDFSVVSTGYNSPPRGVPKCDTRWSQDPALIMRAAEIKLGTGKGRCPRQVLGYGSGEGMDYCIASHAEVSCITNAARMGVATKDSTLYLTCGEPCHKCASVIINSGVSEIVVTGFNAYDSTAKFLFTNTDIKIRLYDFIN